MCSTHIFNCELSSKKNIFCKLIINQFMSFALKSKLRYVQTSDNLLFCFLPLANEIYKNAHGAIKVFLPVSDHLALECFKEPTCQAKCKMAVNEKTCIAICILLDFKIVGKSIAFILHIYFFIYIDGDKNVSTYRTFKITCWK